MTVTFDPMSLKVPSVSHESGSNQMWWVSLSVCPLMHSGDIKVEKLTHRRTPRHGEEHSSTAGDLTQWLARWLRSTKLIYVGP